jgi:hypothetical protein
MITIFGYFCLFMAKRVFLVNVIQLGDCLNWAKILEITEVERIFGVPFPCKRYA